LTPDSILFLVDRDQLATQALDALQDLLDQHGSYWLRPGVERQEKQITVCLLQTMIGRYPEFTSGYFDVVVADECHRSIYGAWQTSLTHFDAFHIGLTATPAAYIERNTYRFYQCKDNQPDFTFRIQDAFRDEFLVPYRFASGITRFLDEGVEYDAEQLEPSEFERKWTNLSTNEMMMREFDRLAGENYRDLAPKQKLGPGKAIVFAITKHHATRLAQYLNELHPEHKGRYAEVITSDVPNADEVIRKFKREDYPMVAVSVDMLTTGFDCREILHLVLCRRVRSPILYQQIRGRGTRTAPHIGKKKFVVYDFFKNHEYFNDSDTGVFAGTGAGSIGVGGVATPPAEAREMIELGREDEWRRAIAYVEVGPEGERVDNRQYVSNWEQAIRNAADDDPVIRKVRNDQPLTENEEVDLAARLNEPEMYFNEDNLRKAYQQPSGNLIDFIRAALGTFKLKSREEHLTDGFHAWMVTKNLTPQQAQFLSLLKNRGIVKGKVAVNDLFQPPLSILDAAGLGIELFGEKGLREIIEDMNDSVFTGRAA